MPAKPRRLPELRRDPDVRRPVADERRALERRDWLPARAVERVDLDLLGDVDRVRLVVERRELERRAPDLELLDFEPLDFDRLDFERLDETLPRCDFVSPFSRRILFTVRAATSSALPP
jgi:hypothetical protein